MYLGEGDKFIKKQLKNEDWNTAVSTRASGERQPAAFPFKE